MDNSILKSTITFLALFLCTIIVACGGSDNSMERSTQQAGLQDASLGKVITNIPAPTKTLSGIAFGNDSLWVSDSESGTIYNLSFPENELIDSFSIEYSQGISALAFDGLYLYAIDFKYSYLGTINKIDISDNSVTDTFDLYQLIYGCSVNSLDEENTIFIPTGLATDGQTMWIVSFKDKKIFTLNSSTKEYTFSFDSPGPAPQGLAFDGQYLWCSDSETKKIYKLNPADGSIILSIDAPGLSPKGLAFDGIYLWCADSSSEQIYLLYIGNDPSF